MEQNENQIQDKASQTQQHSLTNQIETQDQTLDQIQDEIQDQTQSETDIDHVKNKRFSCEIKPRIPEKVIFY